MSVFGFDGFVFEVSGVGSRCSVLYAESGSERKPSLLHPYGCPRGGGGGITGEVPLYPESGSERKPSLLHPKGPFGP